MKINLAVHTSRSVENSLRKVTKNEAEMEEKNCFKKEGISLKRQSKWNVCVMVLTSIEIFQLDFCLEAAVFIVQLLLATCFHRTIMTRHQNASTNAHAYDEFVKFRTQTFSFLRPSLKSFQSTSIASFRSWGVVKCVKNIIIPTL